MKLNRIIRRLFFLISLIGIVCVSKAQFENLKFVNYTSKEGLVNESVIKTVKDKKGFLWIATLKGLSRFDGKNFKNYTAIEGNSKSLRTNWVTDLIVDKQGIIWISTEWGICWYDEAEDNFNYINPMNSLYILYKAPMCLDDKGNIWAATESGLVIIDAEKKKYSISALKRIADPQAICFYQNKIWIGTRGHGLYLYNPSNHQYQTIAQTILPTDTHIMNFFVDGERIWASTSVGLALINSENNFAIYNLLIDFNKGKSQLVEGLMCATSFNPLTGDSLLICGSYSKQIFLFDKNRKLFTRKFIYDGKSLDDLNYGVFYNFFVTDNILWLSTDRGLSKLNINKQDSYTFLIPETKNEDGSTLLIKKVVASNDNDDIVWLLVGLSNGYILKYNLKTKSIIKKIDKKGESYSQLLCKDGFLWAIRNTGIDKFNEQGNLLATYGRNNAQAFSVYKGKQDIIWIGTEYGLESFDTKTHKTAQYNYSFKGTPIEDLSFTQSFIVNNIVEDLNGLLWLSSVKYGLFSFNPNTHIYKAFRQPSNLLYEVKNRCTGICCDSSGKIWLGTMNGLTMFNPANNTFTNYTNKEGLFSNYVYSIGIDKARNIWGRGNAGVFVFNPQEQKFQNIAMYGQLNNTFHQQTLSIIKDNIFVGFESGIISFKTFAKIVDTKPANIALLNFNVLNKRYSITNSSNIELSHNSNAITFNFSAIDFNNNGNIFYSYKLDGFDKDWSIEQSTNLVSYTNLSPGNYSFWVKAKIENGNWTEEKQLINFVIKPAIWQKTWFIALMYLLLALITFLIVRWRNVSQLKIAEEKTKNEQLKAEKLKGELELEQISNFFSTSLINKNNVDEVLWDVAKNLIGKLGFVDCMIYLWNDDKTKLIQKAGYGPKGSIEEINKLPFDVVLGQGVVGYVAEKKEAIIIADTSADARYRPDEMIRLSEICLPIMYENELIGIIDSEHHEKNFYTERHLKILTTISTLVANKIKSIEAEKKAKEKEIALEAVSRENVELQLAALRSQMNPHFIFNSLNSIQKYIWENKQEDASEYLTKFAKLIRLILEHSAKKLIRIDEEILALQLYLELEHRRCNNKFDYQFSIDKEIDNQNILVPPMLIQPHIENAIWHGLLNKEERGLLKVELKLLPNHVVQCKVEDDGVGRIKTAEINSRKEHKTSSFGTDITNKRLKMSNSLGLTGDMIIEDLYNEKGEASGTLVQLNIPIEVFEKIR